MHVRGMSSTTSSRLPAVDSMSQKTCNGRRDKLPSKKIAGSAGVRGPVSFQPAVLDAEQVHASVAN